MCTCIPILYHTYVRTYVIAMYLVYEQYRVKQTISQSISFTGVQLAAFQCMPVLLNATKNNYYCLDSESTCRV